MRRRTLIHRVAGAAVLMLAATACGTWNPLPSVNVRTHPLELTFGRKVQQAQQSLTDATDAALAADEPDLPPLRIGGLNLSKKVFLPVEDVLACDGPDRDASVEDPPGRQITKKNRPEEGDFRTEVTGKLALGEGTITADKRQAVPGRTVDGGRLSPSSALTSGFNEAVRQQLGQGADSNVPGFEVPGFEYRVRDWVTKQSRRFVVLTPQEGNNDNTGAAYRRVMGLYLDQLGWMNDEGKDLLTIKPASPIKILEFPIIERTSAYRTSGFDPVPAADFFPLPLSDQIAYPGPGGAAVPRLDKPDGGVIMTSEASVVQKELVFACNELTEAWRIDWTLTMTVPHKQPIVGVACPSKPPPAIDTFMDSIKASEWPLPVGQEGTIAGQARTAYEQYTAAYEQYRKDLRKAAKPGDDAIGQAYPQVPRAFFCQEITGTYWLATQYGGWPVQDQVHLSGDLTNGDVFTRILQVHPTARRG